MGVSRNLCAILTALSITVIVAGCKDKNEPKSVSQSVVADSTSKQPSSNATETAPQPSPEPPSVIDTTVLRLSELSQGDDGFRVNGMPILGQRFRFRACVDHSLFLYETYNAAVDDCDGVRVMGEAAFEDARQHSAILREPARMRTVIASTGNNPHDTILHIIRVE